MIIVPAQEADLHRLLKFRKDTSVWLGAQGIDQWAKPFPAEHILASIRAGEVYMVKEQPDADAAATVTLDQDADVRLWTAEERTHAARYVHKLTVDRKYAGTGLGARILDWAGDRAAREGAQWLRLDAWTTNPRLHAYYEAQGFEHIRTSTNPNVVSGWVAQRPAKVADHGLMQPTGKSPHAGHREGAGHAARTAAIADGHDSGDTPP
ncbi:GNAT family N-acetyltransferase [Streptomyces salyersiae]|uniref:GNAT family N-acetyltransferase n=1 Tax=Streptomyces salyersiae TaxID=3075530 RepID=A0ABU2RVM3_9ACTN|nr:GNAT family N-acetyltransferase [Streptomyces sp. DSM 41770]MDT0432892.1 GNAT family N-acetyltransferase [Streptomyces sp. DSM 41770]